MQGRGHEAVARESVQGIGQQCCKDGAKKIAGTIIRLESTGRNLRPCRAETREKARATRYEYLESSVGGDDEAAGAALLAPRLGAPPLAITQGTGRWL
jgi:hypothetical protein